MKVLKKGRKQAGWATETICTGDGNGGGGCGAKLLVEQGDLFWTYRSYMGKEEEYFTTFECPECKLFTDIKKGPIPARDLPSYKDWKKHKEDNEPLPGFPLDTWR